MRTECCAKWCSGLCAESTLRREESTLRGMIHVAHLPRLRAHSTAHSHIPDTKVADKTRLVVHKPQLIGWPEGMHHLAQPSSPLGYTRYFTLSLSNLSHSSCTGTGVTLRRGAYSSSHLWDPERLRGLPPRGFSPSEPRTLTHHTVPQTVTACTPWTCMRVRWYTRGV